MKKVTYIVTLVIIALFLVQSMGLAQSSEEIIQPGSRPQDVRSSRVRYPTSPLHSSIDVIKTASPIQVTEPGGMVTFTVVILNTSTNGWTVTSTALWMISTGI